MHSDNRNNSDHFSRLPFAGRTLKRVCLVCAGTVSEALCHIWTRLRRRFLLTLSFFVTLKFFILTDEHFLKWVLSATLQKFCEVYLLTGKDVFQSNKYKSMQWKRAVETHSSGRTGSFLMSTEAALR